jgi:hypothetical protein
MDEIQLRDARATLSAVVDSDLAITASRGYTVVTRNPRHFQALAVPVHNPFDVRPN